MTLTEFKAWFEGFTDSMDGPPGERQWAKIKERVSQITGNPVTHHYWYDHYYRPYWAQPFWGHLTGGAILGLQSGGIYAQAYGGAAIQNFSTPASGNSPGWGQINSEWDSHVAMSALGRADAQSLTAEAA